MADFDEVLEYIEEILEDETTPKNVAEVLKSAKEILKEETEASIKIDKCVNTLEKLTEDPNLAGYVRTHVWNIVSMLEKSNS